jgi:hypothetical protein
MKRGVCRLGRSSHRRAIAMNCPKLKKCPFYNDKMPMESGLGAIYKKKYCMGSNANCARYMVLQALGPEHVPNTLYPSMLDVAQHIIASAGNLSVGK